VKGVGALVPKLDYAGRLMKLDIREDVSSENKVMHSADLSCSIMDPFPPMPNRRDSSGCGKRGWPYHWIVDGRSTGDLLTVSHDALYPSLKLILACSPSSSGTR
jgi:hypothetical protein